MVAVLWNCLSSQMATVRTAIGDLTSPEVRAE